MDLFEYMRSTNMEKEAPLAARMRPRTLDEVVGQEHIIGKDKLLYRAIKADKMKNALETEVIQDLLLAPLEANALKRRVKIWMQNCKLR